MISNSASQYLFKYKDGYFIKTRFDFRERFSSLFDIEEKNITNNKEYRCINLDGSMIEIIGDNEMKLMLNSSHENFKDLFMSVSHVREEKLKFLLWKH